MRVTCPSSPESGAIGAALQAADGGLPDEHKLRLDELESWLEKQQAAVRTLIEVSQRDLTDVRIAVGEASRARGSTDARA